MRRLPRRRRRPPRWRRFLWSLVTAVACLGCVTAGALWLLRARALTTLGSLTPPFGGCEQVNLLVLGVDDGRGGLGRSDTMLLLHVDTRAPRIAALSIPRDTRVELDSRRAIKINAAHARGGPKLAARVVSELTGLPVHHTLSTNFAGFARLVDLVGGIDLNVEQAMDYEDHWGGLKIHLRPGIQHLDGDHAVQFVRFRKSNMGPARCDGSDLSRIARQQKFLDAVAARCLDGPNLLRLPEIIREGQRQLKTDLAAGDLLFLAGLAKEIGPERLKVHTVPGTTELVGGQSYWLPDRQKLAEIVRQRGEGDTESRYASGNW
jgi:polyisoprenyl-teichoic acid--peptidoglycan teichoic acid transferase